jgi:hypothetical protein
MVELPILSIFEIFPRQAGERPVQVIRSPRFCLVDARERHQPRVPVYHGEHHHVPGVAPALDVSGGCPGLLPRLSEDREEQTRQYGYYGYHHKKLDQSKAGATRRAESGEHGSSLRS